MIEKNRHRIFTDQVMKHDPQLIRQRVQAEVEELHTSGQCVHFLARTSKF